MKNYEIYQDRIINELNMYFLVRFEDIYNNMKIKGKSSLLKYISAFFRKWYYSTLIEDTVITPSYIAEYGADEKNVYPVIKNSSVKRIGSININNIKFSIDNHPICNDFKAIIRVFRKGIVLNDELQMDIEDIKKIADITSYDVEYINYLTMVGIDLGYIEKMPSVNALSIFCASKKADTLEEENNKKLLNDMVAAAIKISSTYLTDDFMGERYNVPLDMIENWLINPKPVDKIFEEAYGEIALEISESMTDEDMDDMERAVTAKAYARGVVIDKWFLTPFSYYFRFINTTYMYEFSFDEEMNYFVNALRSSDAYYKDAIISSAIYSPCTIYKLSGLGAEFFGIKYNNEIPHIFKNMNGNEVLMAALYGSREGREKIMAVYEPEFNVYNLKISDVEDSYFCFNLYVRENMTLDVLHSYITNIFRTPVILCRSYRFYKLPESPFTEYTPEFMNCRGPHTESTCISDVLNEGEECYYEIVTFGKNDDCESKLINIRLESINLNEKGTVYPQIRNVGKDNF